MVSGLLYRTYESRQYVWDTGLLAWVAMTQPTGGGGGGAATIANGADVAEGSTTDVAVQGDNAGTISAKLRGLNKSIASGIAVTAASLPLPTGASTEGTLALIKAKTDNLDVALSQAIRPVGESAPQAVMVQGGDDQRAILIADPILEAAVEIPGNDTPQAITIQGVTDMKPVAVTGPTGAAVAVSAASLPLPANAAKETGGNLALLANSTINTGGFQCMQVVGPDGDQVVIAGSVNAFVNDAAGVDILSGSTSTAGRVGLDQNILSIRGTQPSQVGKLDVVAASGDLAVSALVTDAAEAYVDAAVKPLSLTTDGRLRVATSPVDPTSGDFFDVPDFGLDADDPYDGINLF